MLCCVGEVRHFSDILTSMEVTFFFHIIFENIFCIVFCLQPAVKVRYSF